MLRGRAWKFGDNVSTDHIIPGRYYHLRSNIQELAKHAMEEVDPNFTKKVKPGDFIVAGRNFGCGSSREHAAIVLKLNGISAVIAKSFARIFYRNAINIGLPLLIADTDDIYDGDEIEVDLGGEIKNLSKGIKIKAKPLPDIMVKILQEGGLINYVKKYGDLVF
ncbi:MAG: 3-isopropylmalate dehydratase small subunit [Archaeoglobaceae archaeon]|nr:3-isopropylmalate dehydratase small subunit [Archaeoglobaceae archaeon]MCX8152625.1 3-isopropylmalate dehydratase small subunit [Archaeoglobaceae archaeon]MDW8014093.1 3-isopropylmalate dehydratase small subunit [Archaeoglobaceae archaeon]